MADFIRKLLREPLLHFVLLGAAIFMAYGLVSNRTKDEPGTIVITRGQLTAMKEGFALMWQRPPTREEWEGLIRDRVQEEVYYREALALGLDKDDIVIRRRLRQKMEFVAGDVGAPPQPPDDVLNAYLHAHPELFRAEQTFTFRQIYLNPMKHGENLTRDATQLLTQLNQATSNSDISTLGDSLMVDSTFNALPDDEIAKLFGDRFAAALPTLAPGQWQGPVESGYGVHLVLIDERSDRGAPTLADIRDAVRRAWNNDRRLEANDKFYQNLLKRYRVKIDNLETTERSTSRPEMK